MELLNEVEVFDRILKGEAPPVVQTGWGVLDASQGERLNRTVVGHTEGSSKVISRNWPALNVQFDGFSKRNAVVRSATSCLLTSLDRVTGEAVVMSSPSRSASSGVRISSC